MEEFRRDNVQHMEVRADLPRICKRLDVCNAMTEDEVAAMYHEEADAFLFEFPDVCAVSMIFSEYRWKVINLTKANNRTN